VSTPRLRVVESLASTMETVLEDEHGERRAVSDFLIVTRGLYPSEAWEHGRVLRHARDVAARRGGEAEGPR
jgi:hypothetical protein